MSPILLLMPVLLPIAGGFALLAHPVRNAGRRNRVLMLLTVLTSVLTVVLLSLAGRETAKVYSFIDDFSIAFRIDGFAVLFAGMLSALWPAVMLYAFSYMEREERQDRFFDFFLMTYGVTLGAAFSANVVTLYVFYEMLTLVTLPLVTHKEDGDSLFAGQRYLRYCLGGAALALVPVVLVTLSGGGDFTYGGTPMNRFAPELMRIAFLLGFFGFGTKAALFPLYPWLPTASVAPTPVTALLHAVAVVNTGMFSVTRLAWYTFGPGMLAGTWVRDVCVITAGCSMVIGAALALRQRKFKRRLAFSTMSNLSYMIFGAVLMTPAGLLGGIAHMLFHSVIKISLFLCAGAVICVSGEEYIYELDGMGRKMPVTFACYTIGALSLSGIPPLSGFVSKWLLLQAGTELGTPAAWFGAGALLLAAFFCAIYTLSASVRAYFPVRKEGSPKIAGVSEADWRMLMPICIFTLANLVFGICQKPVIGWLTGIANGLY